LGTWFGVLNFFAPPFKIMGYGLGLSPFFDVAAANVLKYFFI
jgi:hypothetical protein